MQFKIYWPRSGTPETWQRNIYCHRALRSLRSSFEVKPTLPCHLVSFALPRARYGQSSRMCSIQALLLFFFTRLLTYISGSQDSRLKWAAIAVPLIAMLPNLLSFGKDSLSTTE